MLTRTVIDADGFTPGQTTVSVAATSVTQYYADGGLTDTEAAFFTALATTPTIEAVGTYDATANTLTATTLKIANHAMDGGREGSPRPFRDGINQNNWRHERF